MKRALYLRPAAVDLTGLDGALRAWLQSEGIEPVEAAPYDLVAYLPYNDGGDYYHADVSPGMATALVEAIGGGIEVCRIRLRETTTSWACEVDRENDYRVLESAALAWEPDGYGGRPTLAIMTPREVEGAEREISAEDQLSWRDLGTVWSPPPSKPAHSPAPGMPFLRASVGKITYGSKEARDVEVSFSVKPEPLP
ncbi:MULTISPECIES: hypothetical protein [unclassified Methylobacterium]|uniref:hypothetical protein n=1 Tax=unclassified Methylobacterium TaxID=2615210 RepID=UPI0011C1D8AA|nr:MULTISPECIES: hypothetical protein [unclassified Methylobacterium]QEE39810.1 hypothetical protein FVA80_13475 [Methylobacterium sp. WL1]TXN57346.1 hypothetical protein FV241_11835 [Methylobacterium sp. WL2]